MSSPDASLDASLDAPVDLHFRHRVRFGRGLRDAGLDAVLAELRGDGEFHAHLLPIVDGGVAEARPGFVESLSTHIANLGDAAPTACDALVVPGGEIAKNDPAVLEEILARLDRERICRRSVVLVVGGGAVLDVAGYAAAVFHRGVRLVRLPTTTLAQKNLLGAFAVPEAVVCDLDLLDSLPDRHWIAGFAEAVKIAVIRDRDLFDRIERDAAAIRARDREASEAVVRRSAELHWRHIVDGGDPFELGTARPLDFGHWAAHRLESMTANRLAHGEAVAIGIAVDATIATLEGRLDAVSRDRIVATLASLGLPTWDAAAEDHAALLAGLEEFREHLGGPAGIALPVSIGASVDDARPDVELVRRALDRCASSV
ncbi:MAG: 3-dehydroquinate synthase [Planctomycetota bacterium]